jgi:hypothetical protein
MVTFVVRGAEEHGLVGGMTTTMAPAVQMMDLDE